ncbi:hypothetical protein N7456_010703 [Penicillium angulare]|uniref:Uncharacterized protein n=1 Tax=Penicillium angulare TaxID=116970 RepID=A0A9W9F752_9EURO|nr:hypothetical protein N7456_010703 [Penicillium angulare]
MKSTRPLSSHVPPLISAGLNDETVFLLETFRTGLATWMDIFDFQKTYEREVTKRALRSDILRLCICAFTAKNLSLLTPGEVWDSIASRYYGEALNHMIAAVTCEDPDSASDTLTAALLLSSYEVIGVSSISHQSHMKGAMNLIMTKGISSTSVGLDRANFIVFIRHEIWIALNNEMPLQFDLQRWNTVKPSMGASEYDIAQYLMFLIGAVVNTIYQLENDDTTSDRKKLNNQLDEWYNLTTPEFRGVGYGEVYDHEPRGIFFPIPATGIDFRSDLLSLLTLRC